MMSLQEGVEEPFVLYWPPDAVETENAQMCRALLVMKRVGGLLLALPTGFIPLEDLQQASMASEETLLGPHTNLTVPALSNAGGEWVPTGGDIDVQVIDVSLEAMQGLVKLSEFTGPMEEVVYFTEDQLVSPDASTLLAYTREWISVSGTQRGAFYSAEEGEPGSPAATKKAATPKQKEKAKRPTMAQMTAESIQGMAKLLPQMAVQLAQLSQNQEALQQQVAFQANTPAPLPSQLPVSMSPQAFADLMGPPPRTKGVTMRPPPPKKGPRLDAPQTAQEQAEEEEEEISSPIARAMLEQSRALTALVAQMQSGDPLIDMHGSTSSTSSRGAQGREKLQRELSSRSGGFFLTVMQNMFKRMKPAMPVPQSIPDLAATDLSMLQYLERFGGYGSTKDVGIVQYALSYIVDCALRDDMEGVREHLALLVVGLEQFSQDNRWDLAFVLMLLEEPPHQMWSWKGKGVETGRNRAFAPTCPQRWATISLAYLKEMDFIQTRRMDLAKKEPKQPQPQQPVAPKKKGKAAGKGKGDQSSSQDMEAA